MQVRLFQNSDRGERSIMSKYSKEDIFRMVEEEDVAFIRLQFCDIFGRPKNLAITAAQLERALNHECIFDASAISGFRDTLHELYLYPDLNTFDVFPWRPQTGKVARMFCNLAQGDGTPFEGDSRLVLNRVLQEAEKMGYYFEIMPEPEFFLFHTDDDGCPTTITHEDAGFFDVAPADLAENVRRDIILTLEEMGFDIYGSHHELSPAQHEIDFAPGNVAKIADQMQTFKMAVKTIAKKHGLHASFMPKPKAEVNGSGLHLNIYCRDRYGKNLFCMDGDREQLSDTARHFAAGLLAHAPGITLVTNPLVNSYKRLISGFDAPTKIYWTDILANRSAVVNVPQRRGDQTCIEFRSPDGACNDYLAFALCLAAGLDGVKKNMEPPKLIHDNLSGKSDREISAMNIDVLPETLGEALECYQKDPLVRDILGELVYQEYLQAKRKEWGEFRAVVTNWEIENYLQKY